jgi:hypothetical protein
LRDCFTIIDAINLILCIVYRLNEENVYYSMQAYSYLKEVEHAIIATIKALPPLYHAVERNLDDTVRQR